MPYEDRHDADDESIASDDVGELDNGLDDLDIFKRREEEKPAKSLMTEQEKNVTEGSAITQQIEIFDKMIKTRIKLQKLMQTAALLPKCGKMREFESRNGDAGEQVFLVFFIRDFKTVLVAQRNKRNCGNFVRENRSHDYQIIGKKWRQKILGRVYGKTA